MNLSVGITVNYTDYPRKKLQFMTKMMPARELARKLKPQIRKKKGIMWDYTQRTNCLPATHAHFSQTVIFYLN